MERIIMTGRNVWAGRNIITGRILYIMMEIWKIWWQTIILNGEEYIIYNNGKHLMIGKKI